MLDLEAVLPATGKSERQLGELIVVAWKKRVPRGAKLPTAGSVAAKLGLLRKGEPKWWRNHPEALEALAEILRVRAEELVPKERPPADAVPIEAFEELAPLLPGQEPCSLRSDDAPWVGAVASAALARDPRSWVTAAAGSGKSLALALFRQRHGSRVCALEVRRLFDAARTTKPNVPLLIEVVSPDAATDEAALRELERWSAHVCVLAPFRRPRGAASGWSDHAWAPTSDWRRRLIMWAHARAEAPERLDIDDLDHWFHVEDPSERLFAAPGDVLWVAARTYRAGLPKKGELRKLAIEALVGRLGQMDPPWLKSFGAAAAKALVAGRFRDLDRVCSSMPLEEWAQLLPADLAPLAGGEADSGPRKDHGRRAPRVEHPAPLQAVHLLAEAGVLRPVEDARHDVAPWLRVGVERDAIHDAVRGPSSEWGLWAVDASRRPAVDDALDVTSPAHLIEAVRRALAESGDELRTIAATETLFAALGRRLMTRSWSPPGDALPVLQQLGMRQLDLVHRMPATRRFPDHAPLTRSEPWARSIPSAVERWAAEAWNFSFMVPHPGGGVDGGWILPGWARSLRLAEAPASLPWATRTENNRVVPFVPLLDAYRKLVARCADDQLPADLPAETLLWVFIDGPSRGWTPDQKHQLQLFQIPGFVALAGALLRDEPRKVQLASLPAFWEAALESSFRHPIAALRNLRATSAPLFELICADLPDGAFAKAMIEAHGRSLGSADDIAGVPSRFRRVALEALLHCFEQDGRFLSGTARLFEGLSEVDFELLAGFASRGYDAGYEAARRAWAVAPERALDECRRVIAQQARLGIVWLDTAPEPHVAELVRVLQDQPRPLPSWSAEWLVRALPRARGAASSAYALLREQMVSR